MEKRRLDICIGEWLNDFKRTSVKILTYDRLLISFKLMRDYPIAACPVDRLTSRDIQLYLNDLIKDNYSLSTIRKQYNLITGYWKWAMAQGLVSAPVYMSVNLPRSESFDEESKDILTYSHEEQDLMLSECLKSEKPQCFVAVLMLETGMRIGEALALTWDDILWNRRAIRIHSTLIRMSSKASTYVQESPKSKTSRRTIPLSDRAIEILQKLKLRKTFSKYVFAREKDPSMPYSYSSIEFHIRRLCKDLDIPYRGLHAFRHSFATNCYERGCDVKILSKLLGHADVAITYNIYIHLYGDSLEEMRKVLS